MKETLDWPLFPAVSTVAFYNSFIQYIELSQLDIKSLKAALNDPFHDPVLAFQALPVLGHELRHWSDHLATVWGRRRLISSYNAMHSRIADKPAHFWPIVDYRKLMAKDRFHNYYSTVGNTVPPEQASPVWKYQHTCGVRFDAQGRQDRGTPIFFTSFYWEDGSQACRVPISVESLLEAGAVQVELDLERELLERLPEDARFLERIASKKRLFARLYNPELGVYSVGVHVISTLLKIGDPWKAIRLASALSSLCLNLTTESFQQMRIPKSFQNRWGDLNAAAIRNEDLGYAFLLLAHHAIPEDMDNLKEWIRKTLMQAGLPNIADLEKRREVAIKNLDQHVLEGNLSGRLKTLLSLGDDIYSQFGILSHSNDLLSAYLKMPRPPIVCAGAEWICGDQSQDYGDEWYYSYRAVKNQIDDFVAACGL